LNSGSRRRGRPAAEFVDNRIARRHNEDQTVQHYPHDADQAAEFTRLALPLMSRFKIPTDPINYAVWYEYVSGHNAELKQAIDAILGQGSAIPVEMSEDLYRRYLAPGGDEELEQVRDGLRHVLAEVLQHIIDAGGETSRYREILQHYSGRAINGAGRDKIREIVQTLLRETQSMEQSGRTLEEQLTAGAQAVEQLRRDLERIREEAISDALTGLANRRAFDVEVTRAMERADDANADLCLLFIDVDYFKRYNDLHGHLVGDEILRFVARNLKHVLRGRDFAARFDSDEFAVLLPGTSLFGANAVANNIQTTLGSQSLRRRSTQDHIGAVTVSIGVTTYRKGENAEDLLKRAAQALLRAKSTGRNRVVSE
jgi:diguanylate cyclase